MNGTIAVRDDKGFTVTVEQSFGNCPRYIQVRGLDPAGPAEPAAVAWRGNALDAAASALLRRADTLFIASHYRAPSGEGDGGEGVDVSHRGGRPGFIRIHDARTLIFPDFNGNNLFNTIGNLLANPRAGILVPDFSDGTVLHVSGDAEVIWDGEEVQAFAGARGWCACMWRRWCTESMRCPGAGSFMSIPRGWTRRESGLRGGTRDHERLARVPEYDRSHVKNHKNVIETSQ